MAEASTGPGPKGAPSPPVALVADDDTNTRIIAAAAIRVCNPDFRIVPAAPGRATLPAAQLGQLLPVLAGALHAVFACGLIIAALMIPIGLIVPRHRPDPGVAVIKA